PSAARQVRVSPTHNPHPPIASAMGPSLSRKRARGLDEGRRMPLRSFLFAPGNHQRRVEKALTLDADAVILDLEDAVAIAEKPGTRNAIVAAYAQPRTGLLYVRVKPAE